MVLFWYVGTIALLFQNGFVEPYIARTIRLTLGAVGFASRATGVPRSRSLLPIVTLS